MRRICVTIVARKKKYITYSESVSVALVIQHAKRMRHIVICGLPGSTVFSAHYLTNGTIFEQIPYWK